jgi:hypothetical protein
MPGLSIDKLIEENPGCACSPDRLAAPAACARRRAAAKTLPACPCTAQAGLQFADPSSTIYQSIT